MSKTVHYWRMLKDVAKFTDRKYRTHSAIVHAKTLHISSGSLFGPPRK